ncbi:MAG: nucleotidyltransferase family protein [Eubacteriales bacterium]|nr:nucleotidyltransferase family protein [Eubacteriales bacterium]
MEPVVGVICEYDPFHRGHARQYALIRERLPGARIVCVMSGCFTQRGMPALFAPRFRAEAALRAGADLVLELPCAFAVREAENFALGGVSVLDQLGFVTHLSFGVEHDEPEALARAAALCEQPTQAYRADLRALLSEGRSLAAAQGAALARALPESAALFAAPNDILALCYLRALLRLQSDMQPLPVLREGDYHAQSIGLWPSASAVRKALLAGDRAAAEAACGYALDAPLHAPSALDKALLYRLRGMSAAELRALPDCTEGLENRLLTAARGATDRETLLSALKTKRYAYARLNRLLTHALLGVTGELLQSQPVPSYARLLGFRKESEALLSRLKQSKIPVVAKAADGDFGDPFYQLDERAYDLWALGANQPAGLMQRGGVAVI